MFIAKTIVVFIFLLSSFICASNELSIEKSLADIDVLVVSQPEDAITAIALLKKDLEQLSTEQRVNLIKHEVMANIYLSRHQVALDITESLKNSNDVNKTIPLWNYYTLKAIVYWYMDDIEDSLSFHLKAYDVVKSIESFKKYKSLSQGNIGYSLIRIGFFQEAIPYIESSQKAALERGDIVLLASSYNNLGEAYLGLKDYTNSLAFVNKSLVIRIENNLTLHTSYSYHNLGLIYYDLKKYQQAEIAFNKAIDIRKSVGFIKGIIASQLGLIQTQIKQDNLTIAQNELNTLTLLVNTENNSTSLSEVYNLQRQLYAKQGDYLNAYETSIIYEQSLELVVSRKTSAKLASYINTSEAIAKDLNILELEKNAEIKALQVKSERRFTNITLTFGFCLLMVLAVFLWTVQKSKLALSQSNENLSLTLTKLKETQEKLVKSSQMSALTTLVFRMAHQINTPLGIAVTSVSHIHEKVDYFEQLIAQGGVKKSEIDTLISDLNRGCLLSSDSMNKVAGLISQFKMISANLEAETQRNFEVVDVLTKYADLILMSLKHNKPTVTISGGSVSIQGYPEALGKVFSQLITNSIDHAFNDTLTPEITIDVSTLDDHVEIIYQDNGKGIDSVAVNDVFEPFYTTTMGNKNLGIGLSIVYNLVVQLMNGNIKCTPKKSKGIMFCITLPLSAVST